MSFTKLFALIDCNNFYASCEQVFNPKLEKKPLLILSNNDGCVIARSKLAKARGVKMGDPAFLYKKEAASGEFELLSSNFPLYADMSRRVMETLETFGCNMEVYSIDEAFLIFENEPSLNKQALFMRAKVKQWTGIPISIGVSCTKTLAKLANKRAKSFSDGVELLQDPTKIQAVLESTPIEEIWGIGKSYAVKLRQKGIFTGAQMATASEQSIQDALGIHGVRIQLELRGIPSILLNEEPQSRKSIVCSRSFSSPVFSLDVLHNAIASFSARAAEKLRAQQSRAGFLSIFLSTSRFHPPFVSTSCEFMIPNATSNTSEIISYAKMGVTKLFTSGLGYKKAGILITDLTDENAYQQDLFTPTKQDGKREKIMQVLDQINGRYDRKKIHFAAEGTHPALTFQPKKSSPCYTTRWDSLPIAR